MTRSRESAHVANKISDYVLELIPGEERAEIGAHISGCRECQLALARERSIGRLVQSTLAEVSAPGPDRLQRLMPTPPANRAVVRPRLGFSPGWAAAAVLLLLICSTIFLYLNQQPGAWSFSSPTAWSTSVTITDTPTQTATREIAATVEQSAAHASPESTTMGRNASAADVPEPVLVPVPAAPLLH